MHLVGVQIDAHRKYSTSSAFPIFQSIRMHLHSCQEYEIAECGAEQLCGCKHWKQQGRALGTGGSTSCCHPGAAEEPAARCCHRSFLWCDAQGKIQWQRRRAAQEPQCAAVPPAEMWQWKAMQSPAYAQIATGCVSQSSTRVELGTEGSLQSVLLVALGVWVVCCTQRAEMMRRKELRDGQL